MSWTCLEIHVDRLGQEPLDRVLLDAVAPSLAVLAEPARAGGAARRWFFLRYWEGGPHIRLRVGDLSDVEAGELREALAARLDGALAAADAPALDPDAFAELSGRLADAEGLAPAPAGRAPERGVRAGRYAPETDRYGTGALMALSEELFWRSSELVLAFLARAGTRADRVGFAANLYGAVAGGLGVERARSVLSSARAFTESFAARAGEPVDAAHIEAGSARAARALCAGDGRERLLASRARPLRELSVAVARATPRWEAEPGLLHRCVGSHLHMTANRLGLSSEHELLLQSILLRVCADAG